MSMKYKGVISAHITASVGVGVTASRDVRVAEGAVVLDGSHLAESVPPFVVVGGNPARILRHLNDPIDKICGSSVPVVKSTDAFNSSVNLLGCRLVNFGIATDMRGDLIYGCASIHLPFVPVRFFVTSCRDADQARGDHAHKTLQEVLVPISGSLKVGITTGSDSIIVELDSPAIGLHVPTFIWTTQFGFSKDTRLLVLASQPYDELSYIRSFADYLDLMESR